MNNKIKVTIWNEFRHEREDPEIKEIYPQGIHGAIQTYLNKQGLKTKTATLDQPEHGLTTETLDNTDVLIWWGHMAHSEVQDHIVEKVYEKVLSGMGLIVLHSAHVSKIFRRLMGTSCELKWREIGERERVWVIDESHPIAKGLDDYFELERAEMYGEPFDVPAPDQLVFISWFQGGEVFRSGCCYNRGRGKIFYFAPGHETYPTYYDQNVLKVILNAVKWVKPTIRPKPKRGEVKPIEKIT
jgi:trehalose utilization protein